MVALFDATGCQDGTYLVAQTRTSKEVTEEPLAFSLLSGGEKEYLVVHSDARLGADLSGLCEHGKIDGLISVDPTERGWDYLDTLVHEWLHQVFPDHKEEWIRKIARQFVAIVRDKHTLRRVGLQ